MPTPTKGPRLGGSPAHQRIILANLASQLFEHGRITTTETKARRLRPLAEKLITKAKRGDLHSRRLVLQTITDKGVVHQLFTEIAPSLEDREGGYVRITKVGPRKGDNAPMAVIEIVTESVEEGREAKDKAAKKAAGKKTAKKAPKKASKSADVEPDKVEETEAEDAAEDAAEAEEAADLDADDDAQDVAEEDAEAQKADEVESADDADEAEDKAATKKADEA